MSPVKKKTAKKKAAKKATSTERDRYAGYPFAEAYEIQYEPLMKDGKKQYEIERNRQRKPKLNASGKTTFKRDDRGKKIPMFDLEKMVMKDNEPVKKKAKECAQLPWGFIVKDKGGESRTWKGVPYRPCRRRIGGVSKNETVWIREDQLQDHPCLEVVFVDIGQGDGCFMVTPNPDNPKDPNPENRRRFVIDAGQEDNMAHYLNWRHGQKETTFEAAIISHPDSDHYKGFEKLFKDPDYKFKTIYTNGLMEFAKSAASPLGPKAKKAQCDPIAPKKKGYKGDLVTDLVTTTEELEKFLSNKKNWQTTKDGRTSTKQFPSMINDAWRGSKEKIRRPREVKDKVTDKVTGKVTEILRDETLEERNANPVKKQGQKQGPLCEETRGGKTVWLEKWEKPAATMDDYQMLSVENGHLPGYGPDKGISIQVLGPVTDKLKGKTVLRWLGSNVGKTKNGHSVVLRLQFGNVSMMLGGDLNIPSEHLLMSHHTGMESPPDLEHQDAFVDAARSVFQVDIAKSCHHGSSDFTHWFLRALNPIATVISSGDDEPHSHPRSDTLGAIGRYSRSNPRPLIFSTELARSTKDSNQKPWELRSEIYNQVEDIAALPDGKKQKKLLEKLKRSLDVDIARSVAVYGSISVVTDGKNVIIYQKIERKGAHGDYDIYCLEPSGKDEEGPLMYLSKHH